jgi:drug/metabolite transporter (DMT)-like permease
VTIFQVVCVLGYAAGLAAGQFLFKAAAMRMSLRPVNGLLAKAWGIAFDPYFVAAMFLYFSLCVLWVWLVSQIPLAKAYPFVALNFILVALVGQFVFGERIGQLNWMGLLMIVAGVVLATR